VPDAMCTSACQDWRGGEAAALPLQPPHPEAAMAVSAAARPVAATCAGASRTAASAAGACSAIPLEPELKTAPAGRRVRQHVSSSAWGLMTRCCREGGCRWAALQAQLPHGSHGCLDCTRQGLHSTAQQLLQWNLVLCFKGSWAEAWNAVECHHATGGSCWVPQSAGHSGRGGSTAFAEHGGGHAAAVGRLLQEQSPRRQLRTRTTSAQPLLQQVT
jgi:hypothetical protein